MWFCCSACTNFVSSVLYLLVVLYVPNNDLYFPLEYLNSKDDVEDQDVVIVDGDHDIEAVGRVSKVISFFYVYLEIIYKFCPLEKCKVLCTSY